MRNAIFEKQHFYRNPFVVKLEINVFASHDKKVQVVCYAMNDILSMYLKHIFAIILQNVLNEKALITCIKAVLNIIYNNDNINFSYLFKYLNS
jgi:hypothetical protein